MRESDPDGETKTVVGEVVGTLEVNGDDEYDGISAMSKMDKCYSDEGGTYKLVRVTDTDNYR